MVLPVVARMSRYSGSLSVSAAKTYRSSAGRLVSSIVRGRGSELESGIKYVASVGTHPSSLEGLLGKSYRMNGAFHFPDQLSCWCCGVDNQS